MYLYNNNYFLYYFQRTFLINFAFASTFFAFAQCYWIFILKTCAINRNLCQCTSDECVLRMFLKYENLTMNCFYTFFRNNFITLIACYYFALCFIFSSYFKPGLFLRIYCCVYTWITCYRCWLLLPLFK